MREAIDLAVANVKEGRGGPFAALVVKNGRVLSRAANRVTSHNDPTAHAEVLAIRAACEALNDFQLVGCDLYTTCEPCPMCMGAVYWARLDRVFFAAGRADAARAGFDDAFIYDELCRPPDARRLPLVQVLRDEALRTFQTWEVQPDKREY